jgi:hypothetical protein
MWFFAMAMGMAGGVAYVGFCQGPAAHGRAAMIEFNHGSVPANGSVADQLAAGENAVGALTLTAAPTSAQADAVEAALARMVQSSTGDSRVVGPLHDALVKAAYPQQATAQ